MRRVLLPLLFVVLCLGLPGLCRGGQAAVAAVPDGAAPAEAGDSGAVGASGVPAEAGDSGAVGASPADAGAPDAAPAASVAPGVSAEDARLGALAGVGDAPIPDVPPPGWTEAQLADLRAMEIHIRHYDTWATNNEKGPTTAYGFYLFAWDANATEKTSLVCVRSIRIITDAGDIMTPRKHFPPLEGRDCVEFNSTSLEKDAPLSNRAIRIQRAEMDVAPYRGAPDSATLRGLDALPLLRFVPPPPVSLTLGGRPLPKMPDTLPPPSKQDPWAKKLRVHLSSAHTQMNHPEVHCYVLSFEAMPKRFNVFSRHLLRTNIGDYTFSSFGGTLYVTVCIPHGADHIDIKQATAWDGKKAVNAATLLLGAGVVPVSFVTDAGPLPAPAAGPYSPLPWLHKSWDESYLGLPDRPAYYPATKRGQPKE